MADGEGGVWALGVRDCSYQRRHQKVVEESASPALDAGQERELSEAAIRLAREVRLPRRRHGRVPLRARERPLLLHGGQHPAAGRAPRHRGGHGRRPRPPAAARRGRRPARGRPAAAARARDRGPPQRRGSRPRLRARAGPDHAAAAPAGPGIRVDSGVAEGDSVPPQFDSMIAKIIAHGDTREQAIARLRRAVADTMVAIEDGTTNQGFLLELLGRPELRSGEVDTGWLDRLQAQGDVEPVRHADAALVQAAIALCEAAAAGERGAFYALARRGRPHADAEVCHVLELLHRGVGYRFEVCQTAPGPLPARGRRRPHRGDRRGADRARAPAELRRPLAPHGDRAAGRRPARRGRRRPAPDLARRGRPDPQPLARAWSWRSPSRRATRCSPATSSR